MYRMDLADSAAVGQLFAEQQFQRVINLAAQPGALLPEESHAYIQSNIVGFTNVLRKKGLPAQPG